MLKRPSYRIGRTGTIVLAVVCIWSVALLAQSLPTAEFKASIRAEAKRDFKTAIKSLNSVQRTNPDDYLVNLRLGWLHYQSGEYALAKQFYGQAIRVSPQAVEAHLGGLLPLLALKDYSAVEAAALALLKVDPMNYIGNLRLAFALRLQGKFAEAIAVHNKLLTNYPADPSFLVENALALQGMGKATESIAAFKRLQLVDPDNVYAARALSPMPTAGN